MPFFKGIRDVRLGMLVVVGVLLSFGFMRLSAANPAPLDQTVVPTKLKFSAAIRDYRPYAEQPISGWREANDLVKRIGGWRAYAKEIQAGTPIDDSAPKFSPHQGHEGVKK